MRMHSTGLANGGVGCLRGGPGPSRPTRMATASGGGKDVRGEPVAEPALCYRRSQPSLSTRDGGPGTPTLPPVEHVLGFIGATVASIRRGVSRPEAGEPVDVHAPVQSVVEEVRRDEVDVVVRSTESIRAARTPQSVRRGRGRGLPAV